MRYIKTFENKHLNLGKSYNRNQFGFPDCEKGDLIKIYGKNTLYMILQGDRDRYPNIIVTSIGSILYDNCKVRNVELYYEPEFDTENMQYIKYRFLTEEEKMYLFQEMIEEKKVVDLIKKTLDIDLTMLFGYKEYEIENTMNKYNI